MQGQSIEDSESDGILMPDKGAVCPREPLLIADNWQRFLHAELRH